MFLVYSGLGQDAWRWTTQTLVDARHRTPLCLTDMQ